jgi:putative transposase
MRDFTADGPNQRWAGDITYLRTDEGWLYLAVILDLYSRYVVGWAISHTIDRHLALAALNMANEQRRPAAGLLHHSDQGCQYASQDYQIALGAEGFICSMSRRGDCYDNAVVESFWSTLKRELVHHADYATRAQATAAIFEWVECWYNRKRRHSALGYMSPEEYEKGLN